MLSGSQGRVAAPPLLQELGSMHQDRQLLLGRVHALASSAILAPSEFFRTNVNLNKTEATRSQLTSLALSIRPNPVRRDTLAASHVQELRLTHVTTCINACCALHAFLGCRIQGFAANANLGSESRS